MRFETYKFYDSDDVPSALPPDQAAPPDSAKAKSKTGNSSDTSKVVITIVAVPALLLLLVFLLSVIICCRMRRKNKHTQVRIKAEDELGTTQSLQFNLGSIGAATGNFSEANKLGQGGFGAVYKGILPNGQAVAVKRLAKNSRQGELEFKNEVMLLAKLMHRNLVRLLGFCLEGGERLLIYEFVPNSSLDHFIFDATKRRELNWEIRSKIISGVARGLVYLHEESRLRIIHRDLKASNILLDGDLNPKISDFGIARMVDVDQTHADTDRVVGTYGYMAPEYALHGLFSVKSDVYSFGVLLLEIISGRRNDTCCREEGEEDLMTRAWRKWREGRVVEIVDPLLLSAGSRTGVMRYMHIGLLCVQEDEEERPTMSSVALMLSGDSLTLPVPSRPAFVMPTRIHRPSPPQSSHTSRVATKDQLKRKTAKSGMAGEASNEIHTR